MTDEDTYQAKPQPFFNEIQSRLEKIIKGPLSKPLTDFGAVEYLESMIEIRKDLALRTKELDLEQLQTIRFQLELMDQICRDRLNQERHLRMQDPDHSISKRTPSKTKSGPRLRHL